MEKEKEKGIKKLIYSFKYAIQGIFTVFKEEQNMKIHVLAIILVIALGITLKISKVDWIICLILFAIVVSAELFNTAIETTVDLAMPEKHPKAKIAKDISAGAVLVTAIISAIVGFIIFLPRIIQIITK